MRHALFLLISIASAIAIPLTLLENTTETGAVCNDGSPGGYWFDPAPSMSNSNKWVIYLEGGALCFSPETCFGRINTTLTSSEFFPLDLDQSVFVPHDGDHSTWNRVYIPYCSSDLFAGQNGGVETQVLNFTFNGHIILQAIVDDLKAKHNLSAATDVMFWGDSAGAVGVLYNINWLGLQLPNALVKGVPNSGFFLNLPTWQDSVPTVAQLATVLIPLWQPYVEPRCLDAGVNVTYCLDGASLYPHIVHDMFIIQSLIDSYEIFVQLGAPRNFSLPTLPTFIVTVNSYYKNYLSVLQTKPNDGWYLVTCLTHVEDIDAATLNNTTPTDAVDAWSNGDDIRYADYCDISSVLTLVGQGVSDCRNIANRCAKTQYALDPLPVTSSSSSSSISSSTSTSTSTGSTTATTTRTSTSEQSDASRLVIAMSIVLASVIAF